MKVLGVHPVEAPEPCYLIEVEIDEDNEIDWESITQPSEDVPPLEWQVPWDEQRVNSEQNRWAFFFHFLDVGKPLLVMDRPITFPVPTPLPEHLRKIKYFPPC
ncbi:MAG: hypothetical protein IPM21_07530 [Acidobacteria bacterium]|nr:hypothetical protein [Acidobacteriota bacterium]